MNHRDDNGDEDRDLPWDPMWAYVLGEDMDERDTRNDTTTRNSNSYVDQPCYTSSDENRDGGGLGDGIISTGNHMLKKILWQRRKKDDMTSTSSTTFSSRTTRSVDREEWAWEIDTTHFNLMDNESSRNNNNNGNKRNDGNSDRKKWSLPRFSSQQESSWIGTVWKDPFTNRQQQHRSLSMRKSS
jgi:hypothetical protein